jgi:peptide chain release factor 2
LAAPDAWSNRTEAQRLNKRFENLRSELEAFLSTERSLEDVKGFVGLLADGADASMESEVRREVDTLTARIDSLEISYFLKGEFDHLDAVLGIHPGAGGTEASDWAQMLLRLYLRWAERRAFRTEIVDMTPGDEAGLKSVTALVVGRYAYGMLRAEKGVHRLVRISPFDSNKRRHTSFASVDVLPRISDDIKVDIREEDLRIDTFRASGAGGQLVNKTSSAVRITHIPTGIVVQCQNERSQHQNKATAMGILRAKLFEVARQEHVDKLDKLRGEKKDIAFGSQIRSYVFMPYTQVKDVRTGLESHDVPEVMDGAIDPFILAFLRQEARKERDGRT